MGGLALSLASASLSLLGACHSSPKAVDLKDVSLPPISAPRGPLLQLELPVKKAQDPQASALHAAHLPQDPRSERPPYAHLSSTDVWNRGSFWHTDRDNILGSRAVDEWDPLFLINTDRPDATDVAATVGDGRLQIETGFARWRHRLEDGTTSTVESGPNALLRLGIGDRFEGRLKMRGLVQNALQNSAGEHVSTRGASDVELGFKVVVKEQNDVVPMQSVVARLGVPTGSSEISANAVEPGLTYIYNWQARRWWFFRGATGVDLFRQPSLAFNPVGPGAEVTHDRWLELSQSVSSYFQVSKRVGVFTEWFMFNRHGSKERKTVHFHDYGVYLYTTPDTQLDVRVGWQFGDSLREAFWSVGLSTRF